MKLVTIIALGDSKWAEYALTCCLSIKAHNFKQKVGLITDGVCTKDLQYDIDRFFDYQTVVNYDIEDNAGKAFYTKVNLYELATQMCPEATEFINIDADCLMIPSNGVDEFFKEHEGRIFTAYCNDIYNFKSQSSQRNDYTFWCDPLEAKEYFGLVNPMPQLNTSFIYFSKCPLASSLFSTAKKVWHDQHFEYKKYRNVKPDELCFNVACSITNILPHQSPYRPIFMQFASENQQEVYIQHQYKALGFAGDKRPSDNFVFLYNRYANYYRDLFGVKEYKVTNQTQALPSNEIILPCVKRTIFRAGELVNSDSGVFNPDSIIHKDGYELTILRKEKNMDCYNKYGSSSAIPHCIVEFSNNTFLVEINMPKDNSRREDFRLFTWNNKTYSNYTKIENGKTFIAISELDITGDGMILEREVILPIEVGPIEKNWAFVSNLNNLYCVYSLSPLLVFTYFDGGWHLYNDGSTSKKIDFFHKSSICNSTNPILVDDYYLMFFHTKERGIYYHGAVLMDKQSLDIVYSTKNPIQMKNYAEGLHSGLIYVSGCVYLEESNTIRVLYGEADSHACYSDFDKDTLINAIKNDK